jgi:dimethylargininase
VGVSTRTNRAAVEQLRVILARYGYRVRPVEVKASLHLKSAATAVADDLLVIDTRAIDPALFDMRYLEVPPAAANLLRVQDTVLCPAAAASITPRLEQAGLSVQLVDNSELVKAEAGLTCCSLIFDAKPEQSKLR